MKKELIKFIENEIGYEHLNVNKAIKKYFKGKETQWLNKYIHETESLTASNGELYLKGDFGTIVWNCETLFNDLPFICKLVLEQRLETDKRVTEEIEQITRLVTI